MIVKIKKLTETAAIPVISSVSAAGSDLKADLPEGDVTLAPGETKLIHTGLAAQIPEGYFGGIYARSGLALKEGLRPANCVGVVDADYRGELMVALHNDSNTDRVIAHGERIAQLIIQPYLQISFEETEDLTDTERGSGGFGSTGKMN